MTNNALLFNNTTASFLFMIRESADSWVPDLNMLNIHRLARPPPRIYKVADTPIYITVDNNGTEMKWGTLDGTAITRQIVEGPWISNDEIYQEFPQDDIAAFDRWIRERCTGNARTEWEDHLRPQIDSPEKPPYILLTLHERPTAPPSVQPLPPHVAAILIEHAVATGSTCPITMEPLQADTATITPCGHIFTTTALRSWKRHTCPECRAPL